MFNRLITGVAAAAIVMSAGAAYAQQTASAIRGVVTGQDGAPIANAQVTIVHTPSGTTSVAETGAGGAFFAGGLRVGGPYRIVIQAPGFEGSELQNVFLTAGSPEPISASLRQAEQASVVVYATRPSTISLNNGVGSAFTAEDIQNQPSITRDAIRTLLRDPIAQSSGTGNLSVAGVNPRFNGLAIDGSLQKDDLGLGSGTYATARSPVNLDAIEAVALSASDYSVTSSGFTGGLVNVVTRSGGNEFDGSLFYFYRDQEFLGDEAFGRPFTAAEFEEEEYGFTLGGPILKDRLFFFVSYDEFTSASGVSFEASDRNNGVQAGFFDALNTLVRDTYGIDMGGRPQTSAIPETSQRLLAKIDWNITDDHRASFSYQSVEETGTSVSSGSFVSAWYDIPVTLDAYNLQVFSDWSPNLSTTFRANYKEFVRGQICRAGPGVGELVFQLSASDVAGTPLAGLLTSTSDRTFVGGCDRFRHANEYDDSRLQLFGSADYSFGNHLFTVGAEYQDFELYNLFVDTSRGQFTFGNVANITGRVANVGYRNIPSGNVTDAASAWGYNLLALFAQDAWQIAPNLELTAGLRYERYSTDDVTPADAGVAADYGFNTQNSLDGMDLLMPRVSVRWEPNDRTTVTGGFGLFAGGNPHVWFSNAYQPGTVFRSQNNVTNVDPTAIPASLAALIPTGTTRIIDTIAQDFEIPSDWKASVRIDHELNLNRLVDGLGDGYLVSAQLLYTQSENAFNWTNLAQTVLPAAQPTGIAPDGRVIYADLNALGLPNLTELRNGDGGQSLVLSLGLAKEFENGFDVSVGYAYQDIEALTEGTSSRGISSWRGIVDVDRNNPTARTSPFQVEHTFRISLGYERDFIEGLTSRFDLFGDITSGTPFTYTFDVANNNSLFGRAGAPENPFDNQPLYVPTGPTDPLVRFASTFDQTAFFNFVAARGISSGIQEVNSNFSNWNQRWDFQFRQDLPGIFGADNLVGDNRFQFILAVDNVLNLINDEWGTSYGAPSNNQSPIVAADLVSASNPTGPALTNDAARTTCTTQGACVYRFNRFTPRDASFESSPRSVYAIRVGLRYEF